MHSREDIFYKKLVNMNSQLYLYLLGVLLVLLVFKIPKVMALQLESNLTTIEIAQSITAQARHQSSFSSSSNSFICGTWIFPLLFENNNNHLSSHHHFQNNHLYFPSFLNVFNNFPAEYFDVQSFRDYVPIIFMNLVQSSNNKSTELPKFSYRNYEFEDEDFINPLAFGTLKFEANCASVIFDLRQFDNLLSSRMKLSLVNGMLEQMLSTKFSRPHKDYFIFVENQVPSIIMSELLTGKFISELRYKYLLIPSITPIIDREAPAETILTTTSPLTFINTCERLNETLNLFSRKCDSLITSRHFRVTSTNFPSMIRADTNSTPGSGFLYSMIKEASARNNFTFNVYKSGFNGATGFKKEIDGKPAVWVGAIGELHNGEADISFATATTYDRHRIVDPTALHTWYTRAFYIKPPRLLSSWFSLFWPLDKMVWLMIVLTIVCGVTPLLYASASIYLHMHKNTDSKKAIPYHRYLLLHVIDATFRITTEQDAMIQRWKGSNLRFIIILWTIACLVLVTGYKSKLMIFLSFSVRENYPKTHPELASAAKASEYNLYFRYYGGAAYKHYKASNDPMHKIMISKSFLVNSSTDCLQATLMVSDAAKPIACLDYALSADFTITQNFTLPQASKHTGLQNNQLFIKSIDTDHKFMVAWSFRKGSRWTESFNSILLNFYAAGLYDYWVTEDLTNVGKSGLEFWKTQMNDTDSLSQLKILEEQSADLLHSGPDSLGNKNFIGILIICSVGLILGLISFFVEYFTVNFRNSQFKRRLSATFSHDKIMGAFSYN